jgi:hypothetical protein
MEQKQKSCLKEKIKLKALGLFGLAATIPSVSAYPVIFEAMDLYTVFVENVFGGFWLSVFGLAFIMFVIMGVVGGLSVLTVGFHLALFFLAMAIGYTQPLIMIPLWGFMMFWSVTQVIKLIASQSSS